MKLYGKKVKHAELSSNNNCCSLKLWIFML